MLLEIFSDLVCPWCYIGKRRLDSVLESTAGEGVEVVWRAFQLYPGLPAEGLAWDDFLIARYGSRSDTSGRRAYIETEAAAAGLTIDYGRIRRMPNTFDGHRLLQLARAESRQHVLAETLFRYYFAEGRDTGDHAVLLEAAAAAGMDPVQAEAALAGVAGADRVLAERDRAANIDVTGVPCFLVAGQFALPGAQEPDVIAQFLEKARARLSAQAS